MYSIRILEWTNDGHNECAHFIFPRGVCHECRNPYVNSAYLLGICIVLPSDIAGKTYFSRVIHIPQ
jgi:hypothetical protein